MESNAQLLDPADAVDVAIRSGVSRRDALRQAAMFSATLAASPFALAALSNRAYGQTPEALPQSIKDVLSFALTLEHLEYEFYVRGLAPAVPATTTPPAPAIPAGPIPALPAGTPAGTPQPPDRVLFTTIASHERDHVLFLQTALGFATPVVGPPTATNPVIPGRPEFGFDFTARGTFPTVLSDYQTYLAVSQGLEDTGVRAYKGQAAEFVATDALASSTLVSATLQAALQIHSVEARHASAVRRLRGQKGWITLNQTDIPNTEATYAGEEAVIAVAGYSNEQISEAFDEILTKDQVLAIAGPFIRTSAP